MKLIIAGGRGYRASDRDLDMLSGIDIDEVVSAGADGADTFGVVYACMWGLKLKVMRADWQGWGRAAGPRRNRMMAQYADGVVLLPGGIGTRSMWSEAVIAGIEIFDPYDQFVLD